MLASLPVVLRWSTVDGAVEYRASWQEAGQGGYRARWVTETKTQVNGLEADTTYEWWVRARKDYAIGEASQIWQFTTPAESPHVSAAPPDYVFEVIESGSTRIVLEERMRCRR
jgi:hypothetical protein